MVQPAKFHSQLVRWVEDGTAVQDVSVSRPVHRVHWGVTVPGAVDQTVYVWLDALVSYLTAAGYPGALTSWPPHCQTIGKDILKYAQQSILNYRHSCVAKAWLDLIHTSYPAFFFVFLVKNVISKAPNILKPEGLLL